MVGETAITTRLPAWQAHRSRSRFGSLPRWSCDNRAIYSHFARSVTTGSTRIPVRAGVRIGTYATSVSGNGTAMNVDGSWVLSPGSQQRGLLARGRSIFAVPLYIGS